MQVPAFHSLMADEAEVYIFIFPPLRFGKILVRMFFDLSL